MQLIPPNGSAEEQEQQKGLRVPLYPSGWGKLAGEFGNQQHVWSRNGGDAFLPSLPNFSSYS